MAGLGAVLGPLRLDTKKTSRLFQEYVPWALRCGSNAKPLISVYWEEKWEMNVEDMKRELGLWDPPKAIWSKKLSEAAKEKQKREMALKKEPSGP